MGKRIHNFISVSRGRTQTFLFIVCIFLGLASAALAGPANDARTSQPANLARLILAGARAEAVRQTPYIMEYQTLPYPGGDVPAGTGVCTDLVIRAFRNAGIDLQKRLHEDRVARPGAYPTQIWENKRADANIDHRRCQNLDVWFRRHARSLPVATDPAHRAQWQPGDVVFYIHEKASYPWHVAIISDRQDRDGMPLIIDSFPPRTSESHRLDAWPPIHSHYRYEGGKGIGLEQGNDENKKRRTK